MVETVKRILERYGETLTAVTGAQREAFSAVLQPITTKSLQQIQRSFGELGEKVRGRYLLISAVNVESADYLVAEGNAFRVRCYAPIKARGEILYYWGLAECVGEESVWKS